MLRTASTFDGLQTPSKRLRFEFDYLTASKLAQEDERKKDKKDFEYLVKCVMRKKYVHVQELLKSFHKVQHGPMILEWRHPEDGLATGKTLLHIAAEINDGGKFVSRVLQVCPELVLVVRNDPKFKGQSALHIAITTGCSSAFKNMMRVAELLSPTSLRNLLNTRATGSIFQNTVMMGELPLFVAALSFNQGMVSAILETGVKPYMTNSYGDTIFHAIIRFVAFHTERMGDARRMIYFLNQKIKQKTGSNDYVPSKNKDCRYIWFLKNKKQETALQLAAKLGLAEICHDVMNMDGVYCAQNEDAGMFDDKIYDVTEIDNFAKYLSQLEMDDDDGIISRIRYSRGESVLEAILNKEHGSDNINMVELPPIKHLIKFKWDTCKIIYGIWMIFHVIFSALFSFYSVAWSESAFSANSSNSSYSMDLTNADEMSDFVYIYRWVAFTVAVIYVIMITIVTAAEIRKPASCRHWRTNFPYITALFVFAVATIVHVLYNLAQPSPNGLPIVIAIIACWTFNIFFLRGWRLFSFFTVMLRRVILGDLLRVSFFLSLQLISFATTMVLVFRSSTNPAVYGSANISSQTDFGLSILELFTLTLRLTEMEILTESQQRVIVIVLYLIFILTVTVIFISSLIALMSRTCSKMATYRYDHWRLEQLSCILLIEDILFPFCVSCIIKCPGSKRYLTVYDPVAGTLTTEPRYYMDRAITRYRLTEVADEQVETNKKLQLLTVMNATDKKFIDRLETEGVLRQQKPKPIRMPPPTPPSDSSDDDDSYVRENLTPVIPIYHEYERSDAEDEPESDTERKIRNLRAGNIIVMHRSTDYRK